ncbi:hypothetical protein [Rugosimonospora africana]|uniref:Uncharacterized protein n=1 Tax=Rugosimonospora africana TaxID=556532 RepID=A0A8J3VTS3_9ACTN|nr:hypothetical protein [Rugosimonospora africana]GIH17981.1 hypothetical protein Raf01_61530 [Rugosimonospora africana]
MNHRTDQANFRRAFAARWERSSPEQQGRLALILWGHAVAAVLTDGGLAACLALSATRIWRRRDQGWVRATADGGYWKTAAGLALAAAARRAGRRHLVRRLTAEEAGDGAARAHDVP